MPASLIHTHTPTQSCWTPGSSPETVQSHWSPCTTTEMHLQSHCALCEFTGMHPCTKPKSRCSFSLGHATLSHPGFDIFRENIYCFCTTYLTRDSTAKRVCSRCEVKSPRNLVTLWTTFVVLSRYVSSPVAFRCGLRGLHSHVSGRHEIEIRTVPLPSGAWIVWMWTLVFGLNSDLYRLCGSLHGLDTLRARAWVEMINRHWTTTTTTTEIFSCCCFGFCFCVLSPHRERQRRLASNYKSPSPQSRWGDLVPLEGL